MISAVAPKFTAITLVLSLLFLVPATTFADDEKATVDALLLLAAGRHIEAVEQLETLAANGNSFAQLELSNLYFIGHFVPLDLDKASAYASAARENGNSLAIYFQAMSSSDLGALEPLIEEGFELAACGLLEINPELRAKCDRAVRRLASKGSTDAIFWLSVDLKDTVAAADLLEMV